MGVFNVAKEFTRFIGGRFRKHGDKSGEELRDDYLIPLIDKLPEGEKLTVDLTDSMICWSTLEEIFGGLVRRKGEEVVDKIEILSDDEKEVGLAKRYMQEQIGYGGKCVDENWTEKRQKNV